MPGSADLGPWAPLTLHLVRDGKGEALALTWEEAGHLRNERLLRQVTGLDLGYFGATAPGKAAQWSTGWARADRLPSLISLHIERAARLPTWPDLIAATRINANATCLSDTAGKACQRIH